MTNLFSFPEKDHEIRRWLEQIIISPEFSATIARLAILNDADLADASSALSNNDVQSIIDEGFENLSISQCRWLLRNPVQLIKLNEQIFTSGSNYWLQQLKRSAGDGKFFSDFAGSLIAKTTNNDSIALSSAFQDAELTEAKSTKSFLQGPANKVLFIAASVLGVLLSIPVIQMWSDNSSMEEWGWQTVQLSENVSREEYLRNLDQSLLEWYDLSVNSQEQLVARIKQFSDGCDRLIAMDHTLPGPDREWLLDKCQSWKKNIESLAVAARLSNSQSELKRLESNIDDVVAKISLAIQQRITVTSSALQSG